MLLDKYLISKYKKKITNTEPKITRTIFDGHKIWDFFPMISGKIRKFGKMTSIIVSFLIIFIPDSYHLTYLD